MKYLINAKYEIISDNAYNAIIEFHNLYPKIKVFSIREINFL